MKYLFAIFIFSASMSVVAKTPMTEKPSPYFSQNDPFVLVSKQVIGPKRVPVGFAYREQSSDQQDSGWVFLSGKESQEYLDNADNLSLSPLKLFLEMDPSLSEIVSEPSGTKWERDNPGSVWRQIRDYPNAP